MWVEISVNYLDRYQKIVILLVRMWVEISEKKLLSYTQKSSSSWGCELKWSGLSFLPALLHVILLVRMWVEMLKSRKSHFLSPKSSSSWGCELKYLRFAVHPGRSGVILLVRMWVEMVDVQKQVYHRQQSSSSWGCELKYEWLTAKEQNRSHPPREDVSWNVDGSVTWEMDGVILLVRMWVEISLETVDFLLLLVILLVRMWVEISAVFVNTIDNPVILLVRMWVEITSAGHFRSWNCRVILLVRMWVEMLTGIWDWLLR